MICKKKALIGGIGGSADASKKAANDQAWIEDPSREMVSSFDRQKAMLDASRKQLEETEQVSQAVMVGLAEQKDKIQASIGKVDEINDDLSAANKLLNKMNKWWRG